MYRYALSHMHMKCRREVILEHFEEVNHDQLKASGYCCDVCTLKNSTKLSDCMEEMSAIVQVVKDCPDKGEKKVPCPDTIFFYHPVIFFCRLQNG